jgi:hypothetical protein
MEKPPAPLYWRNTLTNVIAALLCASFQLPGRATRVGPAGNRSREYGTSLAGICRFPSQATGACHPVAAATTSAYTGTNTAFPPVPGLPFGNRVYSACRPSPSRGFGISNSVSGLKRPGIRFRATYGQDCPVLWLEIRWFLPSPVPMCNAFGVR